MSAKYWEERHAALLKENCILSDSVSEHAIKAETLFPRNSKVIKLGCETGFDSTHFALQDHHVESIDGSNSVINYCRRTHRDIPNVSFNEHNLAENLKLEDSLFDVAYARLSLHYFSDSTTKNIFKEIARVLKPKGLLVFICKSTKDPLYGVGEVIEQDFYINKNHVKHFFSPEYCQQICKNDFTIKSLTSITGQLFGKPSAYVHVIAEKLRSKT